MSKIRVAIIKFGGLSVGGSERFLQVISTHLPKDLFEVDYFYCDAAPYLGSDTKHGDTDPDRFEYMQKHDVRLIKFNVTFRDLTKPTFDWIGTNFWDLFNENSYDLALTVKSGHPEYPFHLLKIPVVEIVGLPAGIDQSPILHIHPSQYQRSLWLKMGGNLDKSCVIPPPPTSPCSRENLREELKIPNHSVVAGFHQRADDAIFSPTPLQAFQSCSSPDRHFIILGGGMKYRTQAADLKLNNVHFLPQTGNPIIVSKFLNTLDFFAHGRGDGETYGAVFAEAMMHGKPCLSHAVVKGDNGQRETIGPSGWFAENGEDYSKKLDLLYQSSDLRRILSKKSISHAEEYFSLKSCIIELTRHFHKICGKQEPTETSNRIPYGISPLHFLYAGHLSAPDQIAHHVLTGKIPEEFYVHIVKFFLPDVRTFIDIGTNTGLYCFLAAKECRDETKIHCFEPQQECCQILEKTIDLNNWEQKVFVHCVGLSDLKEKIPLYFSGTGSGFDPQFTENYTSSNVSTEVDTLDSYAEKFTIFNVDFIKIDVEGFELKVLKGAEETIKKFKPILFIEIGGTIKKGNLHYKNIVSLLKTSGYSLYRCQEYRTRFYHFGTMNKIKDEKPPTDIHMYLCIPLEKESEVIPKLTKYLDQVNRKLLKGRLSEGQKTLSYRLKAKLKTSPFYPFFYSSRNTIQQGLKKFKILKIFRS